MFKQARVLEGVERGEEGCGACGDHGGYPPREFIYHDDTKECSNCGQEYEYSEHQRQERERG